MMEYNAAKSDLDGLVARLYNQITVGSANGQDPDNIQQSTGCTGSCSSCSLAAATDPASSNRV